MNLYDKFLDWFSDRAGRSDIYLFGDLRCAFNAGYALRNMEMRAHIKIQHEKYLLAEDDLLDDKINAYASEGED